MVDIIDWSRGPCNEDNQIKFKTSIIKPILFAYSDVYILVSGTITIDGEGDNDATKLLDKRHKGVIFKNCTPLLWV